MNSDPKSIQLFLAQTQQCAGQMMANAMFIQKELPTLKMSDELRANIEQLCEQLIGTRFDLATEVMELHEMMSEGSASNDTVQTRIERISRWTEEMHVLFMESVSAAQNEIATGKADSCIFILLAESATNVLNTSPQLPDFEGKANADDEDAAMKKRYEEVVANKRRLQAELSKLHEKNRIRTSRSDCLSPHSESA